MRRAHGAGRIGLLVVVASLLLLPGRASARDPLSDDALVAFCLDPARAKEVARVAVDLQAAWPGDSDDKVSTSGDPKAKTGRNLTIETWRRVDRKNFLRTCRAVAETAELADKPDEADSSSPWGDLLTFAQTLIGIVFGGILTWIFGELRAGTDNRAKLGPALDAAARSYVLACSRYLEGWNGLGRPDPSATGDRFAELETELRRCINANPEWAVASTLLSEVSDFQHRVITMNWLGVPKTDLPGRTSQFIARAEALKRNLIVLSDELSRSTLRKHTAMKTPELPHALPALP